VNPPRTSCAEATAELAALHFSYLNSLYHPQVLAGWEAEGCLEEIRRKLGYRLVISEVSVSESVAPGGALGLKIKVKNEGYAAMFNLRRVYVVLGEGEMRQTAHLASSDARRFAAGETVELKAWLRIPADIKPGKHTLSLLMPDDALPIRHNPDYAVRTANAGSWNPATGANVLVTDLDVDPSAPGAVVPTTTTFEEIL
jgi:hypothetical protein